MIEQDFQENGRESADTNFLVTIFSVKGLRHKDMLLYIQGWKWERESERRYITLYRYHMHEVPSFVHDCQCTVND